jgi:hypothetical protein
LSTTNSEQLWNPIEKALHGPEDHFHIDSDHADALRFNAIKYSLDHHYHHNRYYREVCNYREVAPKDIKTLPDLSKVPLLPAKMFKLYPDPQHFIDWLRGISSTDVTYPKLVCSGYQEAIDQLQNHGITITFSSGTSGRNTFIPNDPITLTRKAAVEQQIMFTFKGADPRSYYIWLGPNMADTNWSIAFTRYNYLVKENYYPKEGLYLGIDTPRITVDLLRENFISAEMVEQSFREICTLLKSVENESKKGIIETAPFMLNNFLSFVERSDQPFSLGDDWIISTGGGWKRSEQAMISQHELWQKVEQVLGIPPVNCQDVYGMSESCFAFPSCEGHYYHIPSTFIHPFVLNEDLEPVGFDQEGRFAFIDPLAHSYPGYIITGDQVTLLKECPVCDRTGPVIKPPITRLPGVEDKGCANVMRHLLDSEVEIA